MVQMDYGAVLPPSQMVFFLAEAQGAKSVARYLSAYKSTFAAALLWTLFN